MTQDTVDKMTFEEAVEWFNYDPFSGALTWKKHRRGSGYRSGDLVGTKRPDGYIRVRFDGASYYAHRIIWLLMYGEFPKGQIDHINGNTMDNRLENLRVVSCAENSQNSYVVRKNNKSGVLGAFYNKRKGNYMSRICVNGKRHYLGLYDTAEEAHEVYMKAKAMFHIGTKNG